MGNNQDLVLLCKMSFLVIISGDRGCASTNVPVVCGGRSRPVFIINIHILKEDE